MLTRHGRHFDRGPNFGRPAVVGAGSIAPRLVAVILGQRDAPERHEPATGSVLVVRPGTALQLSNRGDDELRPAPSTASG